MSVEAAVSIGGWLIDGYANSVPLHFVWTSNQCNLSTSYLLLTTNNRNCLCILYERRTNAFFYQNVCFLWSHCITPDKHLNTTNSLPLHFVWTSNQCNIFIKTFTFPSSYNNISSTSSIITPTVLYEHFVIASRHFNIFRLNLRPMQSSLITLHQIINLICQKFTSNEIVIN